MGEDKKHDKTSMSFTDLLAGSLLVGEGSVALLPQELARPQEGLGVLELPALKSDTVPADWEG